MRLGLSDAEFWGLSFLQYYALIDRLEEQEAEQDFRSAIIVTVMRSALSSKKNSRRPTIGDFFSRLKSKQTQQTNIFDNLRRRKMIQDIQKKAALGK